MNINFELYRLFYEVAREKNMTKASKILHISQPAISKQIMKLEDSLGGKLFIRTKKGVILTENGKEMYKYIQKAIINIECAEKNFASLKNMDYGTLRVGSSTSIIKSFLLPHLEKFHNIYPNIHIQINTDTTDNFNLLREGKMDCVIAKKSSKIEDDLVSIPFKKIHTIFIAGEKYKFLTKKKLAIEDIVSYPLITTRLGTTTRNLLETTYHIGELLPNPYMEISLTLGYKFIKRGFGIGTAVEADIQKELANKHLYKLNVSPEMPIKDIVIVTLKDNTISFATAEFINLLQEKELNV